MTIQKNRPLTLIALFCFFTLPNLAIGKIEAVLGNLPLNENPNLVMEVPSTEESEIILSRKQYVLSYNKYKRIPNWVAWKLEKNQLGSSGRSNNFLKDLELEEYLASTSSGLFHAVEQTEFKGSCFDRGHQIPSADRTDLLENNETTFLMSNMVPQTPFLNRVIWAHLEQYTRDLVQKQGKKAYIIAGPIYDQDFGFIGPNQDIKVPSKEFKIIFILNANDNLASITPDTEVISVVMPNTLQNGANPMDKRATSCKPFVATQNDKNDWQIYKTTIVEIEKLSGLKIIK